MDIDLVQGIEIMILMAITVLRCIKADGGIVDVIAQI